MPIKRATLFAVKAKLEAKEKECETLNVQNDQLTDVYQQQFEDLCRVNQRMDEAEFKNEKLEAEVEALKKKIEELEAKLEASKEENKDLKVAAQTFARY